MIELNINGINHSVEAPEVWLTYGRNYKVDRLNHFHSINLQ